MTDFQAAIGIKQLQKLDWIINERRKIAVKYIEALRHLDNIILPVEEEGYFSNYQSFSIYLKQRFPVTRDELMQKFFDAGISTRRGVMTTHREPPYNSQNLILPLSEDVSDKSILLPIYVPMCKEEIEYVINIIRSV
jgi:dTDP-4-amino-4,6-dideoxygalactose transaminase